MSESRRILVKAGTLVDGETVLHAPGALVLERAAVGWRILAVGAPEEVERHPAAAGARVIDRMNSVVCPALVNAHAHLDLTHIGPWQMPEDGGFQHFIAKVRAERKIGEADIRASVRLGIEASRRGGVVAVGDIAGAAGGSPQLGPWREMCASAFAGTSYVEFFAIGKGEQRGIEAISGAIGAALPEVAGVGMPVAGIGIHPHAPYSVSLAGYRKAIELAEVHGLPICTHAAESLAEREFVAFGTGPLRIALESIGIWDTMPEGIGAGKTPIGRIGSIAGSAGMGLVHVNDLTDLDLECLPPKSVVMYCPRSSEYFKAEKDFGPHRYRELIGRGIKVALGTDSIVNLLDQAGELPRISTWDEMRLLRRRDGTDERLLLRMATTWGASAIGISPEHFELRQGLFVIDLIGIMTDGAGSGLAAALDGSGRPHLLLDEK